jgi:hypothetical protein
MARCPIIPGLRFPKTELGAPASAHDGALCRCGSSVIRSGWPVDQPLKRLRQIAVARPTDTDRTSPPTPGPAELALLGREPLVGRYRPMAVTPSELPRGPGKSPWTAVAAGVIIALAVLAASCTPAGRGQTISGPPMVSILSSDGPVNNDSSGDVGFNLTASTSVANLRTQVCGHAIAHCWPDAGNPSGMLYLATGLTLGGCSGWTHISAHQPADHTVIIKVAVTSSHCPIGAAAVASPQTLLLGLPALSCNTPGSIDIQVKIGSHLERATAAEPSPPQALCAY